jgi:hypothetical protein
MEEMEEEMYDDEEEFLRQPLSRVEEVDEEDEEDSDEDNIVLPLIKHQDYDDDEDEDETFEEETEDEEEDDSFEVWAPDLVKNLATAQAVKGSQVKEKPLVKKVSDLHLCVIHSITITISIIITLARHKASHHILQYITSHITIHHITQYNTSHHTL